MELVAIDYVQKLRLSDREQRTAQLSRISAELRNFGLKNNVVVIGLLKMNKAGAGAILRGEEAYGTEIDGSSAFEYDCTLGFSMFLNKPELICNCPLEVLLEYKRKYKRPRHTANGPATCPQCGAEVVKSPVRFGRVSITKARDAEMDTGVPIVLHGPRLKLGEYRTQSAP